MIEKVIEVLRREYPDLEMRATFGDQPYRMLVAVMLSARSKDKITIPVAKRLFKEAGSAREMVKVPIGRIEEILRPIGFYRNKAKYVRELSKAIVKEHGGTVPKTREELMGLPGVGRKTTNVIMSQVYGEDAVAVDTHVHRISNRLGWVKTEKPEETEPELEKVVDRKFWSDVNIVMVNHGQKICLPVKPKCEICPIRTWCEYYEHKSEKL